MTKKHLKAEQRKCETKMSPGGDEEACPIYNILLQLCKDIVELERKWWRRKAATRARREQSSQTARRRQ